MIPYIVFGIIGAIFLFVIFILFVPLKIMIESDDILSFKLKFLFFKFDIPVEEKLTKEKKKEKSEKKGNIDLKFIFSFLMESKEFLRKRIKAEPLKITIDIGTAEASSTAVASGTIYGIVFGILAIIDRFIFIPKPVVTVNPHFNSAVFAFSLNGIIKTRIVHIIATAIIFAYKFLKYKKQDKKEEN